MKPCFRLLLLLTAITSLWGCKGWELTDQELSNYYAGKALKPSFHQLDTLGRSLHYAKLGHDTLPLLFLVHGAPGSWQGYFNLMNDPELQERFLMISIDRPGYGKSDYGDALVSIEDQARMMHAILARYPNNRPIILLGRSFGSPIVAQLAADYPELVDALVMLAPPIDPQLEKFWWFSPLGRWNYVQKFLPDAVNVATLEKYAHERELKKLDRKWEKIHKPSTVIQGGKDWIVEPRNLLFAEKKMRNAPLRLVYIAEQDHDISTNRPDLVKKYVLQHHREYHERKYPRVASGEWSMEAITEE
jgi:pimeloyl-ACP methyl ester carboxylesterase